MATALHPQTHPRVPLRRPDPAAEVRLPDEAAHPTKLGFKNPKHIAAIFVANDNPGGYWEDKGYNWFSGN